MEPQTQSNSISFHGKGGEFFGIWIVNILLSIVTLGIYSAWAKVRTKRYFYGNTEIDGDRFEYHATPIQILKGRIVAFIAVVIFSIVSSMSPLYSAVLMIVFYLAVPWLLWSNVRFDSAMTSYRNVRFSFNASLSGAYMAVLGRGIGALLMITLYFAIAAGVTAAIPSIALSIAIVVVGLGVMLVIYAWFTFGLHRYFSNGYQFGDWKLKAELTLGFFIATYAKALALGVLFAVIFFAVGASTLFSGLDLYQLQNGDMSGFEDMFALYVGLYALVVVMMITLTAYTTVCIRNYIFSQLHASNASQSDTQYQFTSTLTVVSFVWLVISNFLLQIVTVGIARPWIMVRTTRYLADRTTVVGDMSQLVAEDQDSNVQSAISDELAQAFDLGVGIS